MTLQEAIDYIENYTWSESRLGLDRTIELLDRLGRRTDLNLCMLPEQTAREVPVP